VIVAADHAAMSTEYGTVLKKRAAGLKVNLE
jgi:hypothetical protein